MTKSKETLILFGSKHDPEVQESIKHGSVTGRKVVLQNGPNYATHHGPCGKVCICKHQCAMSYQNPVDL